MGLFELALKFACLGSMVSVCLHTPQTIAQWPSLQYWLLVVDLLCTAFFTFDATLKVLQKKITLRNKK
jgi:hypothetical protein